MTIIKIWCHLRASFQKVFYKIIYGKNFVIGNKVTWRRGFSVMKTPEAIINIGNNCFFNNDCSLAANKLISIGRGTIMGENVKIYDHNHRFNKETPLKEQGYSDGEVHIGEDCWIGSNVVVLKGAHISNHCVIGAGCVISGHVPEWTIVKQSNDYQMCPIAHFE